MPRTDTRARVPASVAFEDLDRRRLPGAVRTEQGEHLALRDLETDPLDRLDRSVRLAQSGDRDRCHAFPRSGRYSRFRGRTDNVVIP